MAEEGQKAQAAAEAAAVSALAMAAHGEEGRRYLLKLDRLAGLQIENLEKLDQFELSHLRWRRFNDQLSGVLRILLALAGGLMLAALALLLWSASQADGLVVDSFSAAPNLAAQGIGGEVIATDLTDRIAAIRAIAVADSLSTTSAVSRSGDEAVKVEIPETGVSAGEVWRLLRGWLGHERHVSGSLRQSPGGRLVLSAQFGGEAISYSGTAADFDRLEQQMAERLFDAFDPVNAVLYLVAENRRVRAQRLAEVNARLPGSIANRVRAYSVLGYVTAWNGDLPSAIAREKIALAIYPKYVVAHWMLADDEASLGQDEAALAQLRLALAQRRQDQPQTLKGHSFDSVRARAQHLEADLLGDFAGAEAIVCGADCAPDNLDAAAYYAARRHDPAAARARLAEGAAALHLEPARARDARYWLALDTGDWPAAMTALQSGPAPFDPRERHELPQPMLARALALQGRFAAARAVIAPTPRTCYDCLRLRGEIAALQHRTAAAAWFAQAVHAGPSLPFAYADWGEMLLRQGRFDAAIALFAQAHENGPHFADPLEMWGEALIAKNRSDLARAKFADAANDAPNWGRLHLKWGEALLWSGHRDEARTQFAIAGRLFLTPVEKFQLARLTRGHG